MSRQGGTSVHQIPELLNRIMSFADPPSNATNAQVCKKWSEIALDVLWTEVNDLTVLFGPLVPTKVVSGNYSLALSERKFTRPPKASDWKRFETYGKRVRRLTYKATKNVMEHSIFDEVARTRTRLEILPNMHTLHWIGTSEHCVLFMHKGVKDFAFRPSPFASVNATGWGAFFEDLAARMPNITHIHIDPLVSTDWGNIESEMIDLIDHLPTIQNFVFPLHYVTAPVTEALSKLQNLEMIELDYGDKEANVSDLDAVFLPALEEGAFPKLRAFSAVLAFDDVAKFLDSSNAPTNLTKLYIDSPLLETPNDIRQLLDVIVENCKLLATLYLCTGRDLDSPDVSPSNTPITIDTILPMFNLSNLRNFKITHHYPLAFEKDDINLLASSCPSLETLILNPDPLEGIQICKPNLTLDDLLPFARHCTKLKSLGLFIDATTIDSDTAVHSLHVPVEFKSLEQLSVGMSFINDENAVALYLSQILPLNCRVHADARWKDKIDGHRTILSVVEARTALWCGVEKLLPALTQLRMAQRVQTRDLELELANIKMTALPCAGSDGRCQCQSECCRQTK